MTKLFGHMIYGAEGFDTHGLDKLNLLNVYFSVIYVYGKYFNNCGFHVTNCFKLHVINFNNTKSPR